MEAKRRELLRRIPSVDQVVRCAHLDGDHDGGGRPPRAWAVRAAQEALDRIRNDILNMPEDRLALVDVSAEAVAGLVSRTVSGGAPRRLVRVINATGVVIHTNLGRSALAEEAAAALLEVARGYSNLEYDLEEGERGSRHHHVAGLLTQLTGAEDALVVNNNAAAVMLALDSLARGREVVVSRGELVEIGGSFRMPDIMRKSGAIMVEVGTTNRTYPSDYEGAINENTAALLKVHRSNFALRGFVSEVSSAELAGLGARYGVPVMEDLGSGLLFDLTAYGLPGEPTAKASIAAGVDIVTFSGDKLLGGPQAGIILGRKKWIESMAANPLARALRIDKLCLAALEATLLLYLDQRLARERIPTLSMLTTPLEELHRRAEILAAGLRQVLGQGNAEVARGTSQAGGGSLPGEDIPSWTVEVSLPGTGEAELQGRLRAGVPPVITRVRGDRVVLDVRTISEREIGELIEVFKGLAAR